MKFNLSGFWTFLLHRFRVTLLLVTIISIFGVYTYENIPREIAPNVDIPAASITTIWPGANPGDIENLITNKIEQKIKNLENLKEYKSISISGVSIVVVEFEVGSDSIENMQNLRTKIDEAKPDLPDAIPDDPSIVEASISDQPILSLVISGDYSWSELKRFSKILEDELSGVSKVKDVSVKGAPEHKVHIFVDPFALEAYQVGLNEVFGAIRTSHMDMPLGQILVDGEKIEITVRGELEEIEEFMEVPILEKNGVLLKLSDFAVVHREFDKFEVETFFGNDKNSKPAVLIDIIKSAAKGNILKMVNQVLAKIETLKLNDQIPEELDITVSYNLSNEIKKDLATLTNNGLATVVLIFILMFIALGFRESLLASISIPLAFSLAIIVLYILGRTFNGISLFSLVLALGLLVDNSIIISEGMSAGIYEKKLSPIDAAKYTIKTFRWPIISGTLTSVFAFLPMLFFISGVSGQYISVLPITVTTVLLGALFVSIFLLPSLGVRIFHVKEKKLEKDQKWLKASQKWYQEVIQKILSSSKKVFLILGLSFLAFLGSVLLLITKQVLIEIFPATDQTFFTAKIELPSGSSLDKTREFVEPISKELRTFFAPQENGEIWLKNFVFTVGKASDAQVSHDSVVNFPKENILGLTINLTDKESRETPSFDIIPYIRDSISKILPSYVDFKFSEVEEGPPTGAPIEIKLQGNDLSHIAVLAEKLKSDISSLEGTKNIRDSRSAKTKQIAWKFDRDVLAKFGLQPGAIMESLRSGVNGITLFQLTEGTEEIDVDIKIDWANKKKWDDPRSIEFIKKIPLKTTKGKFITFGQIAKPIITEELSEIEHFNGLRIVYVRSDLVAGIAASKFDKDLEKFVNSLDKHPGELIEIAGDAEEGNRLMKETGISMIFALFLILIVLVWQFNSFSQAGIVLIMIPLSLVGVFVGFWICNMKITFPTMIGIVALAGIIVNDAIVLIDRINEHLKMGHEKIRAFIAGGTERLQPIFLTSITTIIGLLPLSFSDKVWGGLGFAVIFGMTLSTVLTLLLVPSFLMAFSFIQNFTKKLIKISH